MTTLAELQARFQSFLLGPGDDQDGRRHGGIEQLTIGTDRLPVAERLAVYANAYRLRLLEVLVDDFPGLKGIMGDRAFDALGAAYIDACPSRRPSIRRFGHRLPAYLREAPAYRDRPALAEMAAFEWAQGEVMDAADSPVTGVEDLARLDPGSWPGMVIVLQNALRRLDLSWNVPVVWQAIRDGGTLPALERAGQPVAWLLWRLDLKAHWRSLDDVERYGLDSARDGKAFGDICEGLLARTRDDQVPLRAAVLLKRWVTDELVVRIDV